MLRTLLALACFILLPPGSLFAAIRGSVIDLDGKAISGAKVAAYSLETPSMKKIRLLSDEPARKELVSAISGSDGSFSLDVKDVPFVHVQVTREGFAPAGREVPREFDMSGVLLRPAAASKGKATKGGKPLADAFIRLSSPETTFETRTDAEGNFVAPDPAKWLPRVSIVDRTDRTFWSAPRAATTLRVDVPVSLVVKGTVVGIDGKTGVDGAEILVDDFVAGKSGADGTFSVKAGADWRDLTARNGRLIATLARATFRNGSTLHVIEASEVTVALRSRNKAVPAGIVNVDPVTNEGTQLVGIADEKGNASFLVPPSRYRIYGVVPGAESDRAEITTARAEKLQKTLNVRPLAYANGFVVDERGRAVGAARVMTTSAGSPNSFMRPDAVMSGADGRFSAPATDSERELEVLAAHRSYPEARSTRFRLSGGRKDGVKVVMPAGLSIHGSVVDMAGKPVADVAVNHFAANDQRSMFAGRSPLDQVRTDAAGKFVVVLGAGTYNFHFIKEGYGTETIRSFSVNKESEPIRVQLSPGVEITGRVLRGGNPLPDVRVSTTGGGPMGPPPVARIEAENADGTFSVKDLKPGPIHLFFSSRDQSVQVRRTLEAPARDIVVEVPVGARISGRVVDKETKSPIRDFQAGISGVRSAGGMMTVGPALLRSFSDDEGRFVLENVRPGAAELEVRAAGYAVAKVPGLTLEDGKEVTGIEVFVDRGTRLVGKVTGADGLAVEGASVRIEHIVEQGPNRASYGGAPSKTDDRGEFTFDALAAGDVTVVVFHPRHASERKVVALSGRETRIEIRLARGVSLEGRVIDESGAAVADAVVYLSPVDDRDGTRSRTDAGGRFHVEGIGAGRYRVIARKTGLAESEPLETEIGDATPPIQLTMKRGATVVGRVTGLSPEKLSRVQVESRSSWPWVTATVDPRGNFRLEGLSKGSVPIVARLESTPRREVTRMVQLNAGEETSIEIDFGSSIEVSGRVTRDGQPLSGASVTWSAARAGENGTRSSASATTGNDGRYEVQLPQTGDYNVWVFDSNSFTRKSLQHTVTSGGELDIEMKGAGVRGKVLDASTRQPIVGAMVTLQQKSLEGGRWNDESAATSQSGEFTIDTVPEGSFVIRARKDGYSSEARDVQVGPHGADVELLLTSASELRMRFFDARSGKPVSANLLVFDAAERIVFEGRPRETADGDYKVGLTPGSYRMVVGGRGTQTVRVSVPSAPLRITLGPTGSVAVRNVSGSPKKLRLVADNGELYHLTIWSRSSEVEVAERATWDQVTAGRYSVQVLGPQRDVVKTVPLTVLPDQETTLTID